MTVTQQFLIISALPLSFLVLIAYFWRSDVKRRQLRVRWTLTLLAAAVWASSILRHFGGDVFSSFITYNWGVLGTYAFTSTAIFLLLTTFAYLPIPASYSRLTFTLSVLLWVGAIALDPNIWGTRLAPVSVVGFRAAQFDIWGAVWVTSWLVPVLAAWMLTQQLKGSLPQSLYRNQVSYWLLVLSMFFVGNSLGSIQQPGQFGWQQAGLIILILAALTGTITFTRSALPNLQMASRQVLSRISGTLIIFGLTWGAIALIVRAVTNLPPGTPENAQTLIVLIAAALFAGLFTAVYRFVNDITRRIFIPATTRRESILSDYTNAIGNLPEPKQLGQLFLRLVQSNLATDDAWFFTAEDGPAGKLVLRPLASLDDLHRETVDFAADSPLTDYFRRQTEALVQYDIDTLNSFAAVPETERALLNKWERVLFKPVHVGDSLIGVLALGAKYSGESYEQEDFEALDDMARQLGPLLAQAQNVTSLRQINDYVFQQNQTLAREKQHLQELTTLHAQFIRLISPDLRRPFTAITKEIQQIQAQIETAETQQMVNLISQQLSALKSPIDHLITMSSRIQMRHNFNFQPVQLEDVVQSAMRNLRTMAEARRVQIEFNTSAPQLTVLGDDQQLMEAFQHVLHNAIKFNKIGGVIQIEGGLAGGEIFLRVVDTGVGIPEERLDSIWKGLDRLMANGNGRSPGLGLALTSFIIHAHGGRVEAQSKYGSGSVFTLYLPLIFDE